MFKKTLLALALTGFAGVAGAATISTGATVNVSLQGNLAATTPVLNDTDFTTGVVVTSAATYVTNDILEITVSGGEFDKTDTPTIAFAGTGAAAFVDFSNDNTVRFRITTDAPAQAITVSSFTVKTAGAVDKQDVTFSSRAISVNPLIGAYDATTTAAKAATFRDQVALTPTKLDGEVSTSKGRKQFTTKGGHAELADDLVLTLVNNAGDVDGITFTKATHNITGDFSFLMDYDADKDGAVSETELDSALTITNFDTPNATVNSSLTTVTITESSAGATGTVGFKVKGEAAKGSVLTAPQSFTVSSVYTDGTTSVATGSQSAGSWTLDGSSDNIELMPFGAAYAQSITVANRGTIEGAITVTLKTGGMTYSKELTQVATANSVTDISKEVADFAAESGVTGNAHVNVVVNAPDANIGVKGVYYHKASQDRVLTY